MSPFLPPLTYRITLEIDAHHHTRLHPVPVSRKTLTGTIVRGRVRAQLRDAFTGILSALKREREAIQAELAARQTTRRKRYYD